MSGLYHVPIFCQTNRCTGDDITGSNTTSYSETLSEYISISSSSSFLICWIPPYGILSFIHLPQRLSTLHNPEEVADASRPQAPSPFPLFHVTLCTATSCGHTIGEASFFEAFDFLGTDWSCVVYGVVCQACRKKFSKNLH